MPSERRSGPDDTGAADEAVIESVGFDVAHDSEGLLVVTLRYPNGARSLLQLDGAAIERLVAELGLESTRDLVGHPFSALAPALPVNRPR